MTLLIEPLPKTWELTAASSTNLLFLTHPQVAIDPAIPVPDWTLSQLGVSRMEQFAASSVVAGVTAIYCSDERKAVDTARILSERTGVPYSVVAALHENDRSATGYLPPEQFEAVADRFFAEPETSVLGWERAVDAQSRIVDCIHEIVDGDTTPAILSSPPTAASAPSRWPIFSGSQSAAASISPDPAVATFSPAGARLWNCSVSGKALM